MIDVSFDSAGNRRHANLRQEAYLQPSAIYCFASGVSLLECFLESFPSLKHYYVRGTRIAMLLELGLPSFDTLLYNSRVKFGNQVQCSQKSRPCYCAVAADFMICVCFLVVKFPETVKFQPKCTEFRLRLGLRPDPLWGLISPHAPFVIRRGDGWKGERDPQSL